MSIVAFKKKSVINHGSNRSGKSPGGIWLPQGPFGPNNLSLKQSIQNYGPVGFSINGGNRNIGYIGKTSMFSKQGTRFRGTQPYGSGGSGGNYPTPLPVFNVNEVIVLGDQHLYIKPSVLSTYGMLNKKYKWIKSGQYPNNWVQPNYTGNQVDTNSQGMYIHTKKVGNTCILDVNNINKYNNHIVHHGPTLCKTSAAKFTFNSMVKNAPYTKTLFESLDSSDQTIRIQRKCANQLPIQKPFPYAKNGGTGILTGGINLNTNNSCNTSTNFTIPPAWYLNTSSGQNKYDN
jgi:hypothetical protein